MNSTKEPSEDCREAVQKDEKNAELMDSDSLCQTRAEIKEIGSTLDFGRQRIVLEKLRDLLAG